MDYKKIIEAQSIDITKLPEETQTNIKALKKMANMKNTEKRQKELNDLIYHQIIDWLADEQERIEGEKKKSQDELIEARRKKLLEIGLITEEGSDVFHSKDNSIKILAGVLESDKFDEGIEQLAANVKAADEAYDQRKSKEDALAAKKVEQKKKAQEFGLW